MHNGNQTQALIPDDLLDDRKCEQPVHSIINQGIGIPDL